MKIPFYLFFIITAFISCNSKTNKSVENPKSIKDSSTTAQVEILKENNFRIILSEPPQTFIVNSNKVSTVIGKKGLKVTVNPEFLETENGLPIGKQISIEIKELTNQDDLFKNDAPTVSDGRLLVSGGAYYIGMKSNGNLLRLKAGKIITIQMPKLSDKEFELFYGQKDSIGNLNWKATGKPITQKSKKSSEKVGKNNTQDNRVIEAPIENDSTTTDIEKFAEYVKKKGNRISTREMDSFLKTKRSNQNRGDYERKVSVQKDSLTGEKITVIEEIYYNPVEIENLGWINCDRFYNTPQKANIKCEFDSLLKTSIVAIYVIYKRINSIQKEYVNKTDKNFFQSLYNKYPIGEPVNIIAVANKGNNFYVSKNDFTIQENNIVKLKFNKVNDLEVVKQSYKFK